jgi:hypothetical protein
MTAAGVGEWRPIASAPKDVADGLLGHIPFVGRRVIWWIEGFGWTSQVCVVEPTHWQPLPPPPEASP